MTSKTVISTPYPSVEEVASELGVSKQRVLELRLLLEKISRPKARKERPATRARKRKASRK
jgi:hypothetical protein